MQRFASLVLQFRVLVIIATSVITIVLALMLPRLQVDSDILNYLPDSDPAVRLFDSVGEQFAGNSLAIVGVEADDVFTAPTIRTINRLTEKIKEIPEVTHVTSLTDVLDIREDEWGLEVGRLINKHQLPTRSDELAKLRTYTLNKDLFAGRIVSEDGTVALVIARLREGTNRTAIAEKIHTAVDEINPYETIYYAGTPFQMREIQHLVVRDLRYLLPIVSLLLVLVLACGFGTVSGIVLPLLTVFLSTVWTLGFMALFRVPLTVISNITPIVLVAVGSAYGIHLVSRTYEESLSGHEHRSRIQHALAGIALPIVLTGITTLIGFLSFTGSYLTIIKYFGLFTALGIFFAMILSVTFLPAVQSYEWRGVKAREEASQQRSASRIANVMDALGAFVISHKAWILVFALFLAVLSILGLPRLSREVDMLKYFPKNSSIRITEHLMEEKFGGSIPIQVSVHGDLSDPLVLKEMWRLEKFLETVPAVYKPQSIADLVAEMNYVMNGRYTIPDTREEVSNLWFFIEGEETLEQLVNSDRSWGLIQANMSSINSATIRRIVDQLDNYIVNNIDGALIAVSLGNTPPASSADAHRKQQERIAALICMDIAGRDCIAVPTIERVTKILSRYQIGTPFCLKPTEQLNLGKRVARYYSEDLAQATIQSPPGLVAVLSDLAAETTPSEKETFESIRTHLAQHEGAVDSLAIADDCVALRALIREARGDFRADRALVEILSILPEGLHDDLVLRKRLRGDLWELNHKHVLLKVPAEGPSVTGSIDPVLFSADQTGIPLIYKHLDENLVKTQIVSLILTTLLVFTILAIQFRSLVAGVLGAVPLVLTVLVNFGVMSYFGLALDMATVLVGSVAIGIGIDYTIHFLSRVRKEAEVHHQPQLVLKSTLETTGRAILINALTVGLGFLVLLMASVVPIRNFGWLVSLTMLSSSLGALLVLPSLILVFRPRFVGTLIANNHSSNPDLEMLPVQEE